MLNNAQFADVELVAPEFNKTFLVSRLALGAASQTLKDVIAGKQSQWLKLQGTTNKGLMRIEWTTNKKTGNNNDENTGLRNAEAKALEKVVRLCYGETQRVEAHECVVTLAMIVRLQVKGWEKMVCEMVEWMKNKARNDVCAGVAMLHDCVCFEECGIQGLVKNEKGSNDSVEAVIAKQVLTKEKMKEHRGAVVEEGLMELPVRFLFMSEFCEAHTSLSEFAVCRRYVMFHTNDLNKKQKEQVMMQCGMDELGHGELEQLCCMKFVRRSKLARVVCGVVKRLEKNQSSSEHESRKQDENGTGSNETKQHSTTTTNPVDARLFEKGKHHVLERMMMDVAI